MTTTTSTLSDVLLPRRATKAASTAWLTDALLVVLFSGVIALSARIVVPLAPVPVTGQTFGVLFTGAVLGGRRGALAVLLYLLQGAAGLPVFASGAGFAYLLGKTGGYLLSYPFAAALVGHLAERGWDRRPLGAALAMLLGNVVIWTCGVCWLAPFVGGSGRAVALGFAPFLVGDLLKIALAALLLPGAWSLVRRLRAAE